MATTSIWAVKNSLADVVNYANNPEKTGYQDLRNVLHYAGNEKNRAEVFRYRH